MARPVLAAVALLVACGSPESGHAPAGGSIPPSDWSAPLADAEALARVVPALERRPGNAQANARFPTSAELEAFRAQDLWGGADARAHALQREVTGNPGRVLTTDELIQWAAAKWGFEPDLLRAVAVKESWWRQNAAGDYTTEASWCPAGAATRNGGAECAQSYGLVQLKVRYHGPHAWPLQRDSTAFVLDYLGAHYRAVWQGWMRWLESRTPVEGYPRYPSTRPEDVWGVVGQWYSGSWYSAGGNEYAEKVRVILGERTWEGAEF